MSIDNLRCALFLTPKQHDFTVTDWPQFITELRNIGLIADTVTDQENNFYTGKRYLDYIAYMGCAPAIQFEASETSENFCHVIIHQHESEKLIVSKTQARAPHCPNCNKPVKEWLDNKTEDAIHCPLCSTRSNIADYNWRKMGGYGRLFIEITDIFPKEATPQQTLLDKLTGISKADWSYFYSCR